MNKWLLVSLIPMVIFCLIFSGCGTKAITDPEQVVNVSFNKEFTIALGSNITTGYSWQPEYDLNALTLVGHEYKSDDTMGKVVGAVGTEYFHFKAIKTGNTQISFTYYRPWETPKPEDSIAEFNVVVK